MFRTCLTTESWSCGTWTLGLVMGLAIVAMHDCLVREKSSFLSSELNLWE